MVLVLKLGCTVFILFLSTRLHQAREVYDKRKLYSLLLDAALGDTALELERASWAEVVVRHDDRWRPTFGGVTEGDHQ